MYPWGPAHVKSVVAYLKKISKCLNFWLKLIVVTDNYLTIIFHMSHDKIDVSLAKIESVSWDKFSTQLARQFEDWCIPGKDWNIFLG